MTGVGHAKWYAAQIKPNGFERAVANLANQDFETFMPMQRRTIRHARQLRDVLRPVFPGYLFVKFGVDRADWRKINSTFGVTKLVSFVQSEPAAVPDELIAGLKMRCDSKNVLQPLDDLKSGEKVRLQAGPFADFIGEVDTLIGDEGVRVLLEIMGQTARIDIKRAQLDRL